MALAPKNVYFLFPLKIYLQKTIVKGMGKGNKQFLGQLTDKRKLATRNM